LYEQIKAVAAVADDACTNKLKIVSEEEEENEVECERTRDVVRK
jgi:predicted nucleic acid-binding Zn ribbon protein